MAGAAGDEAESKEVGLVHVGIKFCLGDRIVGIFSPAGKVVDRTLRAVGVVNKEGMALRREGVRGGGEGLRRLKRADRARCGVAVDRTSDKVVISGITNVLADRGDEVFDVDETCGKRRNSTPL